MEKKLIVYIFVLSLFGIKSSAQNIKILGPSSFEKFTDILNVDFQTTDTLNHVFLVEISLFQNNILIAKGTTNNFILKDYIAGDLFFTHEEIITQDFLKHIKNDDEFPNGIYSIHYSLYSLKEKMQVQILDVSYTIPSKKLANEYSFLIKDSIKNSTDSLRWSLKIKRNNQDSLGHKKPSNYTLARKDFKSSAVVSSTYNYGLQQFNPNASKPQGYFLYNGIGTLSYKVVPLNISFQYTDFKEYYGIPKYFRVSLDTRQLKENILNEMAKEKKKVQDSLNASKNVQKNTERKIAILKNKLDTAKMSGNDRLLNKVKQKSNELFEEEKLNTEKYIKMKRDSALQAATGQDSSLSDSLNHLRQQIAKIREKQKIIEQERARYERMKNQYDSTEQQLKKYEKKYEELKTKTDALEKINKQFSNPDSIVKAYVMSRMPHPESKFGKATMSGIGKFVIGLKTVEVGMCNPNYSPFLINGTPLKGINIEWQNKRIFVAVTYGKTVVNPLANLQRNQYNPLLAVRNVYNYFDFNNDTLTRKVFSTKLGIGKEEGNNIYIGYLNGTGSSAIANDTSIHHKKERNGVNEIGAQLKLGKNNSLRFIYAKSSLLKLQNLNEASLLESLEQIYKQQYNESAQLQWSSYLAKTKTALIASITVIQPYYESFGLNFLIADNIRYEIQIKQSLTNKVKIGINYRYFQDNLLWLYNQRNLIQTAGLTIQYKINKNLTFTGLVSPAVINKKSENKANVYSNPFQNNNWIANGLIKYKNKKHQFDLSNNFYKFNYDTLQTIYNQASISHTIAVNKTIQLQNELLHFFTSNQDTSINSCIIAQSGIRIKFKKCNAQILIRESYNNQNGFDYGYDLKIQYPITKHLYSELSTSKYVGGNFLLGFNDALLKKYPYQTMVKVSYQW